MSNHICQHITKLQKMVIKETSGNVIDTSDGKTQELGMVHGCNETLDSSNSSSEWK